MSTNKFIIVKPFLGSGKERKRKFFGLSTLGNPVIKEDGRFNWEEPQEEWVANSLHCS